VKELKQSLGERIFGVFNIIILSMLAVVTIYPMLNVLAVSFSHNDFVVRGEVNIIPKGFTLTAYHYLFNFKTILTGYKNTFFIVIVGTSINLLLTAMTAYALSKKDLIGRKLFSMMIVFTMMFSGGLIPSFLLVKNLGLMNSLWALILPTAVSAYNMIIMKNFFQSIPEELLESARLDGLTEIGILFKIVMPLSMAAMATIGLFYAVTHWNSFFNAVMYINQKDKWPLQVVLRDILFFANMTDAAGQDTQSNIPIEPLKMATIIATTAPVLTFYPFIQKYFVKGVMVGSVKG
jgi:putative aldouronate transport system permease protein